MGKTGWVLLLYAAVEKRRIRRLFQNVTIPAAWTSKAQDRVLGLTVTAEAVQAANFTPDFNSESPWGDTEIEQCVHETDNSITEVTNSIPLCPSLMKGLPESWWLRRKISLEIYRRQCLAIRSVIVFSFPIRQQPVPNFLPYGNAWKFNGWRTWPFKTV